MAARAIERALGYRFRDSALLETALRHRSAGSEHNERLEFLGDAILGMVVADHLFRRFADASEGQLTRMRAHLVRGPTLAAVARDLGLGEHLELGGGALGRGFLDRGRCGRRRCLCRRLAAGRGRLLRRLAGCQRQQEGQREQQQRGLAGHGMSPDSV